jgi:hypothetical protein
MQDRDTRVGISRPCSPFISMKDLLDFAEWAFGPAGFPNLLVLAYGDFAHHGRSEWTNLLFCRNSLSRISFDDAATSTEAGLRSASFRIMAQNDEYLWDQIEGGSNMLSACPIEQSLDCSSGVDYISDDSSDDA